MPPISPRPLHWQTLKYTVDHRLVGILSNFENGKDPVSGSVAEPFDVFQPNVHRYLLRPIEKNYIVLYFHDIDLIHVFEVTRAIYKCSYMNKPLRHSLFWTNE